MTRNEKKTTVYTTVRARDQAKEMAGEGGRAWWVIDQAINAAYERWRAEQDKQATPPPDTKGDER